MGGAVDGADQSEDGVVKVWAVLACVGRVAKTGLEPGEACKLARDRAIRAGSCDGDGKGRWPAQEAARTSGGSMAMECRLELKPRCI